jgi:hypothetical protein
MSYNGSGTFVINTAGQPVVSGTVISSTAFNALTADLATGLSTAITKDGQTTPTANIPMGNNKITGLAVGTAAADAANLSQAQSTASKLITVSGTDTVTGTLSPTLAAYAAGQMFYWVAAGTNTGAVTLNIDSLGAKAVTRDGSTALAAGDIRSGEVVVVVYDGTRFQVVSQINSAGDATFANVSITSALNVGGVATFTSNPVLSGGTANGVLYLNGSKVATSGSAVTYDGTTFGTTGAANFATSSGNVGIGTSSPSQKLDVVTSNNSATAAQLSLRNTSPNNNITAGINFGFNTASFDPDVLASIYGAVTDRNARTGDLRFYTTAAGTSAERMRLDSTGLGIGTSSPLTKLNISGGGSAVYQTFTNTAGAYNHFYVGNPQNALTFGNSNLNGSFSANELMRITDVGNVGIGTTSPDTKLTVAGNAKISSNSGTTFVQVEDSSTGGRLYSLISAGAGNVHSVAAGSFYIRDSSTGANRILIDSSGNLGLGVTPSAWSGYKAFQIGQNGAVSSADSGTVTMVNSNCFFDGSNYKYISSAEASLYQQASGAHNWRIAASGTAGNTITFTQAMTLDASGNWVIGSTSANSYRARIYGGNDNSLAIDNDGSRYTTTNIANNGTTKGSLYWDNTNTTLSVFATAASSQLIFGTANAERARITSGGTILAGCTATPSASVKGFGIEFDSDGPTVLIATAGTSSDRAIGFYNPNGLVGDIVTNGSATAFNTSSDRRLKENIAPAEDAGSTIDAIEIVKHDWKVGGHVRYGVIAQDLHVVAPEAIKVGDDNEEVTDPWGVDYSKLVPMLVKEIQSLRARVAQLESK